MRLELTSTLPVSHACDPPNTRYKAGSPAELARVNSPDVELTIGGAPFMCVPFIPTSMQFALTAFDSHSSSECQDPRWPKYKHRGYHWPVWSSLVGHLHSHALRAHVFDGGPDPETWDWDVTSITCAVGLPCPGPSIPLCDLICLCVVVGTCSV